MDRDSLIEWTAQRTSSSDTVLVIHCVSGREKWNQDSQQQYKHLPCFGCLFWPLHCNRIALWGTSSHLFSQPHLLGPGHPPDSRAARHAWARLPKAALLTSLWHTDVAQPTWGFFGTLPFSLLLHPKLTSVQIITFYLHPPFKLQWFSSSSEAKCLTTKTTQQFTNIEKSYDLNICTIQAHLQIKWITIQVYSVFLQTEVQSLDIQPRGSSLSNYWLLRYKIKSDYLKSLEE